METVYAFEYQSCIYESAMAVQSLHRTQEGAKGALEAFLQREYAQHKKNCGIMRQCPKVFVEWLADKKRFEDWQVKLWMVNDK